MARELLSKPDGYLVAVLNDKEYVIKNTKRFSTHANMDDSLIQWALVLDNGGEGNVKRYI